MEEVVLNSLSETSLREDHRQVTRNRILDAAAGVFAKRGYSGTSTADIVDAAGLSRGTFYLHFKNKAEVLIEVVTRSHFQPALELISHLGDLDPASPKQLEPWLGEFLELYDRTSLIVRAWMQGEGKEGALLTPIHDQFMNTFVDTMTSRISALRSTAARKTKSNSDDLRLRALLMFVELERFCYYVCIRHADFDRVKGIRLLATMWYSVLAPDA
jgi:AcrR family transcriptional regulator